MELAAGTRVGPYEIQRRIGEGGMGVVYCATDPRLGRQVAIKVLPAALVSSSERLRRFEQEARTVGALNHPNLVTLFDVGHHDGAPYIVTELLEGQSLRKKLVAGPLTRRETVDIATEIAHGLAAAHGEGIVHRDIKPDNIFVLDDGRVKILDFGIAKLKRDDGFDLANAPTGMQEQAGHLATAATGTGIVIGTPGYMAPEQLTGGTVDFRTDIFAFGVVLYEMVARKRPFAADSNIEESFGIMKSEPVALPPSVPVALERIVLRCLEKRPEARFQSAADLAFALDNLEHETSRAQSPIVEVVREVSSAPVSTSAPTKPDAPVAQRRAPLSGILLVIALFALLGGVVAIVYVAKSHPAEKVVEKLVKEPAASEWPVLVHGGVEYQRVTFHAQAVWFARFAPDGHGVIYSARDDNPKPVEERAPKTAGHERWRVMRSEIDRPSLIDLHMRGRLLDVRSQNGLDQLALRKSEPDKEGGVLATVEVGTGQPLDRGKDVVDASFGPTGEIATVRFTPDGSEVEYPIMHTIVKATHGEIRNLRVAPDGKHLAFTRHEHGKSATEIVIVDDQGREVRASSHPHLSGLAWRDAKEVWFSTGQTIHALDIADGKQRLLLRGQLRMELRDVDKSGRMLVAPVDERFLLYSGPLGQLRPLAWLDAALLQSISADGKTIVFELGNGADQTPEGHAMYIATGDADPALLGHARQAALLPDGKAAVIACATGDPLRLVKIVEGGWTVLSMKGIEHLDLDHPISIAADGTHVIVRARAPRGKNRAWSIPLDGADPSPIGLDDEISPQYAVGAGVVAYGEDHGISLVPVAGGPVTTIEAPHAEEPLRFSDDGKYLFVARQHGWPREIERIDVATKKRTPWATIPITEKPEAFQLAISGDGKTVAYSLSVQTSDLYVIRPPR